MPAHRSIKKSNLLTCFCRRSTRFLSRRIMDCASRIASSVTFPLCVWGSDSACSLTSTALDRSDALVEQIICNSRGKTRQPCVPRVRVSSCDRIQCGACQSRCGPVSSASRLAYRRAGEFISEPMPVWNTDWSMTCCIITRFSRSLMLLLLLPILMQMSEHPHPGLDCR